MAAVAVEPWRVVFQPVTVSAPSPNDVVVRVIHSWISNGTEGSFVRGERIQGDTPRLDTDPVPFPNATGYQKCGIVESVGADVTGLAVGDKVFVSVSKVDGMFYDHAGHISPSVSAQEQVWKLPPNVSMLAVSGLVLTQVGYNCGIRPPVSEGDTALVIGDGMVGHWAAQTLQWRGAHVALLGRHEERLSRFSTNDGDLLVNEREQDTEDVLREWAPNGVNIIVDTVGSIPTVESLFPLLQHNGHIVSAGFYGTEGAIDIQRLRHREATLHTPAGWTRTRMDATLGLLAQGVLQTEHLITHRFPATECAAAFDLILSRREPVLGVVLDWE
jgi:2-desacetyl-2-hydroxyethyl bacteriochlorophyllide A dehydrogenase